MKNKNIDYIYPALQFVHYMLLLRDRKNRLATETAGWMAGVDLRNADLREAQVINAYAPNVRTSGMRYAGASLFGSDLIIGGGD